MIPAPLPRTELDITRPIVFVHGTRTSAEIWSQQVDAMGSVGHVCVAVDLPGHGTRIDERFTFSGAMETIDRAVDRCETRPLLVGLSLGGYAALAYAADHPDRLAGVMVSGCSTEIRGKPLGAYRSLAHHISRVLRPAGGTWHVVTDTLLALGGHSSLADLRRILVPVWLVNGRRDMLRLDERRFLAALPGTNLTVVPHAGHDVNTHAPIAFNRILLGILHELRPRTVAVL
jgi:pimeloyl-ACP methyl ester carboxylesterase